MEPVEIIEGQVLPPKRDSRGHWLESGNPKGIGAGRPPSKHLIEELRSALESGDAVILAKKLLEHAKHGKPKDSLLAIDMVADRVYGKSIQQHRIEQSLDAETMRRLASLADSITENSRSE